MLLLALSSFNSVAAILTPMVFYMIGLGMAFPTSLAGLIGPFPKMVGAASSLGGFVQNSFAAIVGLVIAHNFNTSQLPMTIGVCMMGVFALLSSRLLRHEEADI